MAFGMPSCLNDLVFNEVVRHSVVKCRKYAQIPVFAEKSPGTIMKSKLVLFNLTKWGTRLRQISTKQRIEVCK